MPAAWPTASDLMTDRPATLPHDAPVSRALGLMRSRGVHEIPVLRRGRLAGLITAESIARRVSRALGTKVEHLLVLPPLIAASAPYPEIAESLLAAGLRAAPVVGRRGELLGVVSRSDLVRELPRVRLADHAPLPTAGELARAAALLVREDDLCRNLVGQIRLLEEHPFPVVDRKGRLVGAVGVKDLMNVLWRPIAGGKRDPRSISTALDVKVASIMHAPALTVAPSTSAAAAAERMAQADVSSVFVVDGGKPPRVLAQSDLLSLIVARARPPAGRPKVSDIYVEVTGLRGAGDPALLAEIDQLVARGLGRIARHARPSFLSLHFAPHATHRTNDLTVEARLHTADGIYFASQTGWNLMAAVAALLEELASQTRRDRDSARDRSRRAGRRADVTEAETPEDPELEAKIRAATGDGGD